MSEPLDFRETPCNRWLGFRLIERSPQRVVIEQPVRPEMLQETGVVQGGLLTALADTAAVYLLWPDLDDRRTMTGTTVSMSFLSAALADREPLRAIATPIKLGRTLAVCNSEVHQGEQLVATGTFTFLLMERR